MLDAGVIKDDYVLEYDWDDDTEVSWHLVKGGVLKGMDGTYALSEAGGGQTKVDYRLAVDLKIPMIGLFKPQGREGDHRHRAEGAQEARRVALIRLTAVASFPLAADPWSNLCRVRVLLFTGKGGVGKTTVAAATAAHAAAQGRKTLVISTDAAHSLGDAFGIQAGSEPVEVDTGLAVQQVDTQRRFEQTWREVQSWLVSVLDAVGVDPLEAEELTVLPGAEEVLALLEVRRQVESGVYDVVVVDCAPTGGDAAAAGAAGRVQLVRRAGLPDRAPRRALAATGAQPDDTSADAAGQGLRRGRAAAPRARRGPARCSQPLRRPRCGWC